MSFFTFHVSTARFPSAFCPCWPPPPPPDDMAAGCPFVSCVWWGGMWGREDGSVHKQSVVPPRVIREASSIYERAIEWSATERLWHAMGGGRHPPFNQIDRFDRSDRGF